MLGAMDMPVAPRSPFEVSEPHPLESCKFQDPLRTAKGEKRARVGIERLETLWINTGTLCNLACTSCYIESSPVNDALAYLSLADAEDYFDQAAALGTRMIGFTGGEPFMNRDMVAMMRAALARGFELLVLTNAMRPMRRFDAERGTGSWRKAVDGLLWLARAGFRVAVAGRRYDEETMERAGYERLLRELGIEADHLVLFPTMDATADVPEISEGCWDILHVAPDTMMCASSRMVVKAKGDARPHVVACTLLPFDERFAMGEALADTMRPVSLNHPHCARFCVLGGASCSG